MGQSGSRTCLSHRGLLLTGRLWSHPFRSSVNRSGHVRNITGAACGRHRSGIEVGTGEPLCRKLGSGYAGVPCP